MKRFWNRAEVVREGASFGVVLDGRPLRPTLSLGSEALAHAIAAEWQAAQRLQDLPLTRLATTAAACVPGELIPALARYGESDLLCYWAGRPPELQARQARLWRPWLDWAAQTLGVELRITLGVMHVPQPPEALAALRRALAAYSPDALTALGVMVPALGSIVLGLAVAEGALTPTEAVELAQLDERYQAEQWGDDPEAVARRAQLAADVEDGWRFLELTRSP